MPSATATESPLNSQGPQIHHPDARSGSAAPSHGFAWVLALLPAAIGIIIGAGALVEATGSGGLGGDNLAAALSWLGLVGAAVLAALDERALRKRGIDLDYGWIGVPLLYIVWMPLYLLHRRKKTGASYATPITWFVSAVVGAVAFLGGWVIADQNDAGGSNQYVFDLGSEDYTCDGLVEESIRISEESSNAFRITLLDVRDPKVVKDNRDSYSLPSGTGESTILTCRGLGVFDDGSKVDVRMRYSIDAEGQVFVFYKPVY